MTTEGNQIDTDEALDLSEPLRHFSSSSSDDLGVFDQTAIVAEQPRSVHAHIQELSFVNSGRTDLSIKLQIDASPGCGGMAWPAGMVSVISSKSVCLDCDSNTIGSVSISTLSGIRISGRQKNHRTWKASLPILLLVAKH